MPIDFLSSNAGAETHIRIEGRHKCRAERRGAVGCELMVGGGPQCVHHSVGSDLCSFSLAHWNILGSRDQNVEEIGVEKLGNRRESHGLGGLGGTRVLGVNGHSRHGGCESEGNFGD